jgi:ribosomal protein S18 acetylase RimI-like enzyme
VCDKPSADGSSKFNIRPDSSGVVRGALYDIEDGERQSLDQAEPLYTPVAVDIGGEMALAYTYEGEPHPGRPYDWYVAIARAGADFHGVPDGQLDAESFPDPLLPGLRPTAAENLGAMQAILSQGLTTSTDRYYLHPGDLAWWVHHDDPRYPDHFSCWLHDDGFVVIDSRAPREINVFTRPGVPRMPFIVWSQRWLGGTSEVGWVSDRDRDFIVELETAGYGPVFTYRSYEWDLTGALPEPEPPAGWELRNVMGESEADRRRAASHAAFQSNMPPDVHLDRYRDLMRSPVYVPERDLVAVRQDGTIGSFMIWWADPSGVAQIEPFGTHPDFHRQGIGRALLYHGLHQMRRAGMTMARVCTEDDRPATGFYEACGFEDAGRLTWWAGPAST